MLFHGQQKVIMYKYYVRSHINICHHTIEPNLLKIVPCISVHKTLNIILYTILNSYSLN